jgi:hypothetical protein
MRYALINLRKIIEKHNIILINWYNKAFFVTLIEDMNL